MLSGRWAYACQTATINSNNKGKARSTRWKRWFERSKIDTIPKVREIISMIENNFGYNASYMALQWLHPRRFSEEKRHQGWFRRVERNQVRTRTLFGPAGTLTCQDLCSPRWTGSAYPRITHTRVEAAAPNLAIPQQTRRSLSIESITHERPSLRSPN